MKMNDIENTAHRVLDGFIEYSMGKCFMNFRHYTKIRWSPPQEKAKPKPKRKFQPNRS